MKIYNHAKVVLSLACFVTYLLNSKQICAMTAEQMKEEIHWRTSHHFRENSIQEKKEAYLHRRKNIEDNGMLSGSAEEAPDWLKHEKNGLYFPVVHKDVLQPGKPGFSKEDLVPRNHNRRILQDTKIASFNVGGDWFPFGGYFITLTIGSNLQALNVQVDTRTSLLWVGCDCQEYGCATENDVGIPIAIYSQGSSITSSILGCSNTTCNTIASPPFGNSDEVSPPIGCNILGESGSRELINATADAILLTSDADQNCEFAHSVRDSRIVAGPLVYDDIWVQYTTAREATQVLFGCAKALTGNSNGNNYPFDGLLGLVPSNVSARTQLVKAGLISETFSLCLEGSGLGGHLVLGRGEVPAEYSSAPLRPESDLYTLSITAVTLDGATVGSTSLYPLIFVIDSALEYTLVDPAIYSDLESAILEALGSPSTTFLFEFYTCVQFEDIDFTLFPSIVLETGGNSWTIPVSNLIIPILSSNIRYICLSFLPLGSSPTGYSVMGETWLRDFDITFDDSNKLLHWLSVNCSTGALLDSLSTEQLVVFPTPSTAADTRNETTVLPVVPSATSPPPSTDNSPPLTDLSPPPPGLSPVVSPPPPSATDSSPPPAVSSPPPAVVDDTSPPPSPPPPSPSSPSPSPPPPSPLVQSPPVTIPPPPPSKGVTLCELQLKFPLVAWFGTALNNFLDLECQNGIVM